MFLLAGCAASEADNDSGTDPLQNSGLGGPIAASMQKSDKLNLNAALEAAPNNQTRSWENEDNKNLYAVTLTQIFYKNGVPCRDYSLAAEIKGAKQTYQGKACRASEGLWRQEATLARK